MIRRADNDMFRLRSIFLLLSLILLISMSLFAKEKEYNFNSPGSKCYMQYIVYTADSNYTMIRRPIIFILGKENMTARGSFDQDTLKNIERFSNYYFVYLPDKGTTSEEKLRCVEALVSLVTYNYKYGRSNLFFQVNDSLIGRNDINLYGLTAVFKSVRLSEEENNISAPEFGTASIADDFKESEQEYKPEAKVAEDLANYYIENNPNDSSTINTENDLPQKSYFGPPSVRDFTLTGIIRDLSTGEALPFAAIQVQGTTLGTTTNADGYFTLLKVPDDTSTLVVQYVGYQKTPVYLSPMVPRKNLEINIRSQSHALKEVKISAHKDDVVFVKKEEVGTIKLTPLKIEQLPSIGEKDIMRS
ncbi:MAG: carboxypeptidase-like regulatory domain-containing protein, partial [Bacteroidales bacterium]